MIKVVIVAGRIVENLVEKIKGSDVSVEKSFVTIEDFWNDVIDNSSSYTYIDKVVIVSNSFLPDSEMSVIEQVVNVQSIMAMNGVRSDLFFTIKDSDLYKEVKARPDDTLIFRNMNMLLFKELNIKNIDDVIKGSYDAEGIYHPDFLRKNEIDAQLNDAYDESDAEYDGIDKTPKRELIDDYIDEDEELQKEIREREREERRSRGRVDDKPKKKGFFGRKEASKVGINQNDNNLNLPDDKGRGRGRGRNRGRDKGTDVRKDLFKGVIAFTGDRQSGVSTTVSNAASVYAGLGNSVLIIDLDMVRRSQSVIFKYFKDAIDLDSRVAHGLLVSLANPKNLEDVASVVDDNISVLSIDLEVDKEIKRFANRPMDQLFSASNLVSLFGFAKSLYDVVLIDFPFEIMGKVGYCLSYIDRVIMCVPNTEHHLNTLLEVELEYLLLNHDLTAHTLMSKSSLLLTKYNQHSTILGKEATDVHIERILNELDDPLFHLDVLGVVPLSFEYEKQVESNKRIVRTNRVYEEAFLRFLGKVK